MLEGIVRAKQDRPTDGTRHVLPMLMHGDAAFAGQGVVVGDAQLSQLRGYRTGGTSTSSSTTRSASPRRRRRALDGLRDGRRADDAGADLPRERRGPRGRGRVAQLAIAFRQEFHQDVVIDLVCYRRRGHNEGDDPSKTQPLMYNLIEAKRSVRKLYTEALVGRGDITQENYEQAQRDFQSRLEIAFAETHAAQRPILDREHVAPGGRNERAGPEDRPRHRCPARSRAAVGDAFVNTPRASRCTRSCSRC